MPTLTVLPKREKRSPSVFRVLSDCSVLIIASERRIIEIAAYVAGSREFEGDNAEESSSKMCGFG